MRVGTRQSKTAHHPDPSGRYGQFVKLAVERNQVWGLFKDGWALSRDSKGQIAFALWPERELAERSAKGPWQGYEAAEIPLDDLIEQLLPQLARDQVAAMLSPSADTAGELAPIAQLILDLEHERDPHWADDEA